MTISEQVQNDFTNAAGVRKLNGTVVWDLLNDDTVGMFACPDGIRPVTFLLEAE